MKILSKMLRKVLFITVLVVSLAAIVSAEDIKLGIGTVNVSSLHLRSKPNTESVVLISAPEGSKVVIVEDAGSGWYKVIYNKTTGYMFADYLDYDPVKNVELGNGIAEGSSVNVRQKPTTSSAIVAAVPKGGAAKIIGFNNGWYKVEYKGVTGYIRSDLLVLESVADADKMDQLIEYAKQFIGTPYVWGGTTPKPGFDCSGFTQYVCKQFGVSINRIAVDQMKNGVSVSYANLKKGDLVFFERTYNTSAAASHVGFYIGDGQFIHAANAGIKISSLSETYYSTRYVGARRVF